MKIFCRGIGTCPTITVMTVGIILAILGVLAIISGPSCSCSKAVTNFKKIENVTMDYKCKECSWIWLKCKPFSGEGSFKCDRGCIIWPANEEPSTYHLTIDNIVRSSKEYWHWQLNFFKDYDNPNNICLPQVFGVAQKYKYDTISPVQIIGVALCGVGIIVMFISCFVARSQGKHYLL